ncbi:MAG: aspartate/glutamate racemase family protein [Acidiferrobacterales bacterium]
MPSPRIALIHATALAHEPICEAFLRLWPEARTVNLTDDSLSEDLAEASELNPGITTRILSLARYAADCGAEGILFTCSGFGSAIDAAKKALTIPVLKPDEAMIEEALSCGPRIAGLASFLPSIVSLRTELVAAAAGQRISPQIELRHVPGAMEALRAGRAEEHDAAITRAAQALTNYDVLILAQFSMARARAAIADVRGRRILTSPDSAVTKLRSFFVEGTDD